MASLIFEKGIYKGKFCENWMRELLQRKNVETFSDLIIVVNNLRDNEKRGDLSVRYLLLPVTSIIRLRYINEGTSSEYSSISFSLLSISFFLTFIAETT